MKTLKLFSALVLLSQLAACGIDESASHLKSPSVQIYTFNGTGENGATGKLSYLLSPCPAEALGLGACEQAIPVGDSLAFFNFGGHQGALIAGPYLTFQPGPQGVGHISAEVEIQPKDKSGDEGTTGRVVIDLVSRGPNGLATIIHDTQVATFQKHSGKILVSLTAKAFHEPLVDVEVRVRDLTSDSNIMQFRASPLLQVNYTRIIYN